ncbi:MAG: sulfotransferase [Alphaproteobacteria bacterium]|nr:sulfotransferase [Alphaproteobacteria bacterium]
MQSGYSRLDKLLHRMALGSRDIAEMSFRIDQGLVKPDREGVPGENHVFVSGLARAGTTIIMRRLYATEAFRSLTYRDMPFVLAPNLWQRLRRDSARAGQVAERAHGDGVEVGFDSPESLDEVFWRVFCGRDYIRPDRLCPHAPSKEVILDYRSYVAAILASDEMGPRRYLSKNNNNILRLEAILKALPEAVILVPFREPTAHALSLQAQHHRFCELQTADSFVRSYMGWLAHHEFGLDHRPFQFPTCCAPMGQADRNQLSYWLDLWRRTHEWLLSHDDPRIHFICYDVLCSDASAWSVVAKKCAVSADIGEREQLERRPSRDPGPIEAELQNLCAGVYERLRARALVG